jgi:hypothetical protein
MARKLRIEYPGAIYHVMSRGDRREPIFRGDSDREMFLESSGQACAKTGWAMETGPAGLVFGGAKPFARNLVEAIAEKVGAEHYGEERQEPSEGKAEAIVRAELKRRGWTDKTLKGRAKGDKEKVRMAERLPQETTMTLAWIAERLGMGTKTHLSHLLYWQKSGRKK